MYVATSYRPIAIESLGKLRMNLVLSYYPSDGGTEWWIGSPQDDK
jgi:hypothetical protein